MIDVDLSDYVAGAYFLVKKASRGERQRADLIPETYVSVSTCLAPVFGSLFDDIQRLFGHEVSLPDSMWKWPHYDEGMPLVFGKLDTLRHFIETFLPGINQDGLQIVGIGLPKSLEQNLLDVTSDLQQGLHLTVKQNRWMASAGTALGFEVLSESETQMGHSWLCSSLEKDMFELFGIMPNELGLLNSLDDAMKIYEWIAEDECKGYRAEPEPYFPWLLVSYPLTENILSDCAGDD